MRLLALVLGGILALALVLFFANSGRLDWHMSIHGWIALILGVVVSIGLGAGLMALSFYSSRHGYDDRVVPFDPSGDDDDKAEDKD